MKKGITAEYSETATEAKRLGICEKELLTLAHRGVIPFIRITPKLILFNPAEVDKALAKLAQIIRTDVVIGHSAKTKVVYAGPAPRGFPGN
jgi:hypothetical protein